MGWLDRLRSRGTDPENELSPQERAVRPVERASPGIAALFDAIRAEGDHSILDLGEGTARQLAVLAPYARVIRFAGLVPGEGGAVRPDFDFDRMLPAHTEAPYDVVLAWDVLDWLGPTARATFVRRIEAITARGTVLYASVDGSETDHTRPVRTTLLGRDRILLEPTGPPVPARPKLLPAQIGRLLGSFSVQHAFSLRTGVREYVARKG